MAWPLTVQWSNRYPRIDGFSHHAYVEGYDFPTVAAGPTYPAAAAVRTIRRTPDAPR